MGSENGGKSGTLIIVLVACCCCAVVVSCIPVGLYFVNDQFKNWVNKLFNFSDTDECKFDASLKDQQFKIKYDAAKCEGKCVYAYNDGNAGTRKWDEQYIKEPKVMTAKDGKWVTSKEEDCKGKWITSKNAGKAVCPANHLNNRSVPSAKYRLKNGQCDPTKGAGGYVLKGSSGWCGCWPGKDDTFASTLPDNAIAGKYYDKGMLENSGANGGRYGPGKNPIGKDGNYQEGLKFWYGAP